ncbi:hypothetical protein PIB30_110583, partial [Stylosanthes scabra]|nr:hypothetical protein [Stylosanthes scabra]
NRFSPVGIDSGTLVPPKTHTRQERIDSDPLESTLIHRLYNIHSELGRIDSAHSRIDSNPLNTYFLRFVGARIDSAGLESTLDT